MFNGKRHLVAFACIFSVAFVMASGSVVLAKDPPGKAGPQRGKPDKAQAGKAQGRGADKANEHLNRDLARIDKEEATVRERAQEHAARARAKFDKKDDPKRAELLSAELTRIQEHLDRDVARLTDQRQKAIERAQR